MLEIRNRQEKQNENSTKENPQSLREINREFQNFANEILDSKNN